MGTPPRCTAACTKGGLATGGACQPATPSATGSSWSTSILRNCRGCSTVRGLWSARRPAPAWFRRKDYLGPVDLPLDEAVRRRVAAETGQRPDGPIRMLTHLRYFGYCMNPVTFYYCFDAAGEARPITSSPKSTTRPGTSGTPTCSTAQPQPHERGADCCAAASPSRSTSLRSCRWTWTTTGASTTRHRASPCTCRTGRTAQCVFEATLDLKREPLTRRHAATRAAVPPFHDRQGDRDDLLAGAAPALKRTPFFTHPARPASPARTASDERLEIDAAYRFRHAAVSAACRPAPPGTRPQARCSACLALARTVRCHSLQAGRDAAFRDADQRAATSRATIDVLRPQFWADAAFGGTVGAGESYIHGDWACNDLTALVRIMVVNRAV